MTFTSVLKIFAIGQIMRAVMLVLITGFIVHAQDPKAILPKPAPIVASPAQQKEFKPLVEARTKAQATYDAEAKKLPEYAALLAAQKALNDAADKLASKTAVDDAQAKVMETAFRSMAELKLSSWEYQPEIDPKTQELVFVKKP